MEIQTGDARVARLRALALVEAYTGRVDKPDVQFDPHVQTTVGNERVVHGQQQYRGLSLYPHSFSFHIDDDCVERRTGDELLDLGEIDTVPLISAREAVIAAFRHVRSGTRDPCRIPHDPLFANRGYRPRVRATFPMPNRPSVFSSGPFSEPTTANLVLFSRTTPPTLAWLVTLPVERVAEFTIVVDAAAEQVDPILYCVAEAASVMCIGEVYLLNPAESARMRVSFPRGLQDYPTSIRPANSFSDWVETNLTHGNNVTTLFNNGNRFVKASQTVAGLVFVPQNAIEEQLLNAFFVCNYLHDLFSVVGFGEEDGNFQFENPSRKGVSGDRLIVNILPAAHGTANMNAQNDGKPAKMLLGIWPNGLPTALDGDVIIHEYAHGVSQRLVGGPLKKTALTERQSQAMGEGWSDYFAVTIQNFHRPSPRFAFAAYSSRMPNGGRVQPYNAFTANYGNLGSGVFDEQHGAGSVFAAALIAMQTEFIRLFGRDVGDVLGWRSVVASMKKLDANPNFLHGAMRRLRQLERLA